MNLIIKAYRRTRK
jgi:DNA-binding transcriptional ArsR family regulator